MARFLVKASEFKNVCKAVNDRKLAELKKEIIEILKKQDENEVKKAIDYFNSQELHYTHLEKSLVSGKWIEKAGYGIGTVRIWKGKKYKKIAPGKWARVFDKEGRGTNIAIGKLIARVQKIDNVEDLMAFVMQNKQRFVDENGVDLPVLDKLRAAVDARNGNVGNKETPKIENTTFKYDDNGKIKEVESTLIEPSKTARNFKYNKDKLSIDELKDAKNEIDSYIQKLNKEISSLEKIKKENADKLTDNAKANIDGNIAYSKNIINAYTKDKEDCEKLLEEKKDKPDEKKKTFKQEMNELYDAQDKAWEGFESGSEIKSTPENSKKFYDRVKKFVDDNNIKLSKKHYDEIEEMNGHSFNEALALAGAYGEDAKKKELARNKEYSQKYKGQILDLSMIDEFKESDEINNLESEEKVVSFNELQPIATNKSVGENEVQMPYSKDLADEIESLKNCTAPKYDPRETFKHIFYKDGKLVTTDARRMKLVEVGELEGIPDGSYVDISTDKSGINVKKIDFNAQFPNYSKVIPDNLNQTATLDTKLVKDKIKEMYKDGAISKKDSNFIQLEFRDGKVFIDDTAVGEAKDIKMKYSDDWGPARNDTNYMTINADYFVNALSGKTSVMQIGERADKAIAINTGSSSNILMPMSGTDKKMDYSKGRQAKKENDEYKANAKQKAQDALNSIVDTQKDSMNNEWVQSLINKVNNKEMENHKTIIEHAYKALKDAEKMIEKPTKKWTSSLANNKYGYSLLAAVRKNPEFKTALENMAMEYGLIKKSLFDDFIVDVFEADDEEEIEDELYEGETEYNDYSAVQPELFNSTEMKVREALDRIKNQVL